MVRCMVIMSKFLPDETHPTYSKYRRSIPVETHPPYRSVPVKLCTYAKRHTYKYTYTYTCAYTYTYTYTLKRLRNRGVRFVRRRQ